MERRDTKLLFEIKFVLSNDGCIFPSEIPGHQPDYRYILCCHAIHAISHNQKRYDFEQKIYISLLLSGLIEQFGIIKKCSNGFNKGLIFPWDTRLSNVLSSFLSFHNLLMNIQLRLFNILP